MKPKKPWLEEVAEQNERDGVAMERLAAALPKISATDLNMLIAALVACHKGRSISQNQTLSALIELRGLRSSE